MNLTNPDSDFNFRSNLELKAKYDDLSNAEKIAEEIATQSLGTIHQTDTYFHCENGRLKLREIQFQHAELIWYQRPDQQSEKTSHYQIALISHPETLKQTLIAAYGSWVEVKKSRTIFLYENVRIHLDRVDGLGNFIEFEAVIQNEVDQRQAPTQLEQLREKFHILSDMLIPDSYSDLLLHSISRKHRENN